MSENNRAKKRRRRGGGREARRDSSGNAVDFPYKPFITRNINPFDILSDEGAEIIERNAEIILQDIGIDFRDDSEALQILRNAGCDVTRRGFVFQKDWLDNYVQKAPKSYTQRT